MSFVGLYTGLSGIQAAQAGLDVTSNNVANANTPGYTRQRLELAARPSFTSPNGQLGTGVDVQKIARLRDAFLDSRFRSAIGDQAQATIRAEFHASLEFLSGEPDLGLTARIDRLWGAAEAWSNDPNVPATRRQVLAELASITDGFQATAMAWAQLGEDTAARRDIVVTQVNDTLASLAELNDRLANSLPARVGPEVFDQRDLLIDRLAQLTGASARLQDDGSVTITLGSGATPTTLLSHPDGAARFSLGSDGPPRSLLVTPPATTDTPDPAPVDVALAVSGELGGLHRVLEVDLPRWTGELDQLASVFAAAINATNVSGLVADGHAGGPLLSFDPGNPAGTLELLTHDIGALAAGRGEPGTPPAPFDGTNARAFADLRTTRLDTNGIADPDGATIEGRLGELVVGLAGEVRTARDTATAAKGIATGAQLARAAEHGVSIDEEMVGLVRYQRALEAAARVMTTVDQALDTLVNRVGIVGR